MPVGSRCFFLALLRSLKHNRDLLIYFETLKRKSMRIFAFKFYRTLFDTLKKSTKYSNLDYDLRSRNVMLESCVYAHDIYRIVQHPIWKFED